MKAIQTIVLERSIGVQRIRVKMPPKRKTATRSTRRTKKDKEEQEVEQETPEVEEPPKKQARARGRKKKTEIEEQPAEVEQEHQSEATKEIIEPEPVVVSKKQQHAKEKSPNAISTKSSAPPPTSPSKRVSSISSRIPSPVKKHLLVSTKPDLEFKKTEQAINQNFLSKNLPKLTNIIEELKSSKAENLFDELKTSTETRFKTSDDLINSLTSRNQQLSIELEELRGRLSELESSQTNAVTSSGANEEETFTNELVLDMMEQIVGLRIHSVEDTDDALSFDCSQSGKNGVLDYKLTIPKEDSSEIIYTPVNKDESELKNCLPDYFFDDLTFPIDTLQQFYHKIYRGLNK